jgi:hypothetical protein
MKAKIDWTWVFTFVIVGIFTRTLFLSYIGEGFDNPSAQRKATNCPDGTRTTDGHCLLE